MLHALLICALATAIASNVQNAQNSKLTSHPFKSNAVPPMSGYVYTTWDSSNYNSSQSQSSISALAAMGVTHLEIVVTQYVVNTNQTLVQPSASTPSDASIAAAAAFARAAGMQVILKPHVDSLDGQFRGEIGLHYTTEAQWSDWWSNYTSFIVHYAALAAANNASYFNVGTELTATEQQVTAWRAVIAAVRAVFKNPIWYGTNWNPGVTNVAWWDALDFMGVDAYFPLANASNTNPTVQELVDAWQPYISALAAASANWSKPVVFSEIGYASFSGAAFQPYACCSGLPDTQLQASLFQAFFQSVWTQPWFAGVFWWAWSVTDVANGPCNTDFSVFEKPAAAVISTAYGGKGVGKKATATAGLPPLVVYADGQTVYQDWSWNCNVSLNSTENPFPSHTYSAAVSAANYGEFVLHNASTDISGYTSLVFDIIVADVNNSADVGISFCTCDDCSATGCAGPVVTAVNYAGSGSCILPSNWGANGHISVPLTVLLPLGNTSVNRVQIADQSGSMTPMAFMVDNIQFV